MKLLTEELRQQLMANGAAQHGIDHTPLVRIFDPAGAAIWLITEMELSKGGVTEPDRLFGLCDLGFGFPELGFVSLAELEAVHGSLGIGLERDLYFKARAPLSVYAEAARFYGRVVETGAALTDAARRLRGR